MISVLLVEDEPEVLELIRLFLERDTELALDNCSSVKEALQKLNQKTYNVIVSDYVMPEADGIQLLKTLKAQRIDTPLIFFTGKGDEEVAIEALNSGAAFYLQKSENPRFQFAKLRKMIHEAALKQHKEEIFRENSICVVIPTWNDEKNIGAVLDSVPEYIMRIYAVDDASSDRTPEIIKKSAENDSRIVTVRHDTNKGVGAAVSSGYHEALKEGMDIAVVMYGNKQMDPVFLPGFLEPIIKKQADYAVGNRIQSREYRKGLTRWKVLKNTLPIILTKIASGYWRLMDPENGYTSISRKALERIGPKNIFPRYGYCSDILVRLNTFSFKVININHPARGRETTRIKDHTSVFRLTWLLFKDFLWRMKEKYIILNFHPLVFFYLVGILCTIMSFFLGIYALYGKIFGGEPLFLRASLTLIVLFIGSMFILIAMLLDMEQERHIGLS